jgi:hypothetical protein
VAIDIERLKREYRATCNKCCINPDEGPASSFDVARARGELAKMRKRQTRYTYSDWQTLRDVSTYWIEVLSHMAVGGWNQSERALWNGIVHDVRRRHPKTMLDVALRYDGDIKAMAEVFDAALTDVLREAREDALREAREEMPLSEIHRRQRERGHEVNPLGFKMVCV